MEEPEEKVIDMSGGLEDIAVMLHADTNQFQFHFEYIKESFAGAGREDDDQFEEQYSGCSCSVSDEPCRATSCECIDRFGTIYDEHGCLLDTDPSVEMMRPIIECNRACECAMNTSYTCSNRIIQRGLVHRLQIFQTLRKGVGVMSLERIERNTFVCEYAGEIISDEEARIRAMKYKQADGNYILTLREHFGSNADVRCTHIDATHYGNVGRLINHSCDPNLYMVPARVNNSVPRAALFALRVILPGEELAYEYSGDLAGAASEHKTSDELLLSESGQLGVAEKLKRCFCDSTNCRKYLPSDSSKL